MKYIIQDHSLPLYNPPSKSFALLVWLLPIRRAKRAATLACCSELSAAKRSVVETLVVILTTEFNDVLVRLDVNRPLLVCPLLLLLLLPLLIDPAAQFRMFSFSALCCSS